jgi:hypothetical protein
LPRNKVKHPGLKKQYNSRIKQEYLDCDYVNQLSEEEKDFLSDFNEEYYGANLDYKDLENNRFHKTQADKKACTDRNNARNRCLYGNVKASGRTVDVVVETKEEASANIEDALIDYIDSKD